MPRRSKARSVTIPPPLLGWNTKDPISAMDEQYAVEALNFFTKGGSVDVRSGYRQHVKNAGTSGDSIVGLYNLSLQSGTEKLVALEYSGHAWDATSAGGSPTDLGSVSTSGTFFSALNFRGKLFIKALSSVNDVYYWDGAAGSVTLAAFSGPSADDKALRTINSYKSRLYFVGADASVWYGGIDAITGALEQFDVQSVLTLGGKLLFAGPVQKTGDVNEELFAMISNRGEVLLYSGDWPEDDNWQLVGHYYMPPPIGYRSFFYWGANIVIITSQGVVLLSEAIKGGPQINFLTDKINNTFIEYADLTQGNAACGIFYPEGNALLITMTGDEGLVTFAMSTVNGSWWLWSGVPANDWGVKGGDLYFATGTTVAGGKVYKMTGEFDESRESEGTASNRTLRLRPAYNYFGDRESTKQFVQAVPTMYQSEGMQLTMDADVDFANVAATQTVTPDNADTAYKIYQPKVGLKGIGKCASIRIDQTVTTKKLSIQAIEVQFLEGDIV